jgi:Ca2+-binding RTX toxin-like protein
MSKFTRFTMVAGGIASVTAVGLALSAAPAMAATTATVSVLSPGTAKFDAATRQANYLQITAEGRIVTFDDEVPVTAGAGCTSVPGDNTLVTCDLGAPAVALGLIVNVYDRDDTVLNDSPIGMLANGGAGGDLLRGSPTAADTIQGGAGDDSLSSGGFDSADGGNSLTGGAGNDTLHGSEGNDLLNAGDGNDTVYANGGNDTLRGGAGNDELISGLGADLQDGGPGRDGVFYTERSEGIVVDLDNARGDDGEPGEGDSTFNVEDIYATTADDVLTGNDADNAIYGSGGQDTIAGLGGDDLLEGGLVLDGYDTLDGGDNRTAAGDTCRLSLQGGTTVNCETVEQTEEG